MVLLRQGVPFVSPRTGGGVSMARKVGQIIRRGTRTWLVRVPRQERRQIGVLTVEQARTFVRAIAGHQYWHLFAIALTTGMRPSEYLGLTWNDLDLDRGTVSVSHTLEWRK